MMDRMTSKGMALVLCGAACMLLSPGCDTAGSGAGPGAGFGCQGSRIIQDRLRTDDRTDGGAS